jgi:hypothetical protein
MRLILAVEAGYAREQVLIALARHQIPVVERGPPEIGQQRVARPVHPNLMATFDLHGIV